MGAERSIAFSSPDIWGVLGTFFMDGGSLALALDVLFLHRYPWHT